MKNKNKKKKEEGAVAVIVAVALSVLFGFTALSVDFGMMASNKGNMQNAADAAALAAAKDLGNKKGIATIYSTAGEYTAVNGYDDNDDSISVETFVDGSKVTVTVSQEMKMGFSAVLTGQKTRTVTSVATAEAVSLFGGCPYAMFAGQKIEDGGNTGININGNGVYINGNIHSNSKINIPKGVLADGVSATAVGSTNPTGAGWNNGSIAIDMPSIGVFKEALTKMDELVVFNENKVYSHDQFGNFINDALTKYKQQMGNSNTDYLTKGLFIYVNGTLTFNGQSSAIYSPDFPITVVVKGNIVLNGSNLGGSSDIPIAVMSETGNLTVNGGGASFHGILYAPNGDVTINGSNAEFTGSIVAQNIIKNGGKVTVNFDEKADDYLPLSKVHLID